MISSRSRPRPLQVAVLALCVMGAVVLTTAIRNGGSTLPSVLAPSQTANTPADRTPAASLVAAPPRPDTRPAFTPPSAASLPDTEFGKTVRRGEQIFLHTPQNASKFAGNNLNCSSCHLDAGRRPDAAPMWAAYVMYPAYRAKNGHVNTLAERLQGCFRFSMNGKPPAADDPVLIALQTYMFWLADKAPTGVPLKGHGYPKLPAPAQKADYLRGSQVYARNCAVCHGDQGQGQKNGEHWVFPALWGPDSFNWGAGMHQIKNAAGFIKVNMPLGRGGLLSDQEAWDVAYFMNAHERPQDPRYTESVARTRAKYHDSEDSLYGLEINGHVLGSDAPPSGGKLAQGAER
ncbi:c-type cytochrome [Achromobacter xylosoxidans]|nr:c-type cytochrome [Achromobacter xylosoxidans]